MNTPKLYPNRKISVIISTLFISIYFFSCVKSELPSSTKGIVSFLLLKSNGTNFNDSDISVNIVGDTVKVVLPAGTNLNGLIPKIVIKGVSISPETGVPQDFSKPVTYTVKAQDSSFEDFYVIVSVRKPKNLVFAGSSDKNFYALDALTGSLKWKFTGGGWFSYARPAIYNGIVYAGCTDNNVYAFDVTSGNLIWKFTTGGPIESSLTVSNGVVYVGSDDHNMYALNAVNGNFKWKYLTGYNVSSSPAVYNGSIYFGSDDGNLYALDTATGNLNWKFVTQNLFNQSGATVSNGIVFIGNRDGNLYAIDAASGSLKWKYNTNGVSLEESSPTVSNGLVFIGGWYNVPLTNLKGSLYAIDEAMGTLRWQSLDSLGFSSGPYVSDDGLYISADDGNFYSVNSTTGAINWSKLIYPNGAGAVVANGIVYVGGGGSHYFYAFDVKTGNIVWKFGLAQTELDLSSPCVIGPNGEVYNTGNSVQ